MYIEEENVLVNDYLDLYLYADKIGDQLWKEELIQTLQQLPGLISQQAEAKEQSAYHELVRQYQLLNRQLLDYYSKMRNNTLDEASRETLLELKKKRVSLGRKLFAAK